MAQRWSPCLLHVRPCALYPAEQNQKKIPIYQPQTYDPQDATLMHFLSEAH